MLKSMRYESNNKRGFKIVNASRTPCTCHIERGRKSRRCLTIEVLIQVLKKVFEKNWDQAGTNTDDPEVAKLVETVQYGLQICQHSFQKLDGEDDVER